MSEDFITRVGRDYEIWSKVIGRHGIGKENANGSMLLDLSTKQNLVVINTIFQQVNKYKASWMHPRSKHWHLIDFVLVRQRDLRAVRLTRVMRPTSSWSDHRMVLTTVFLAAKPAKRAHTAAPLKKLDVAKLKDETICSELQQRRWQRMTLTIVSNLRLPCLALHRKSLDSGRHVTKTGSMTKTLKP